MRRPTMKRVLVIDDEPQMRRLLCLLLHESGFDVIEASDGKEGLQTFRRFRPDLVLCDVFMPEKDGLETMLELSQTYPSVKIIALTGGFGGKLDLLSLTSSFG